MTYSQRTKSERIVDEARRLFPVALADEFSRRRALGSPNASVREWGVEELVEIRARALEVARVLAGGE